MTDELNPTIFLWMMQNFFLRVITCVEAWVNIHSERQWFQEME